MGRAPCCDKANVKKGPWSPEEDAKLKSYIEKHGTGGNWIALPQKIGLKRCGKSCRLRWLNYLRPNIKHGDFSEEEDRIICSLYVSIGSRWSIIAAQLPGRTDNDIKNYWNTRLKKKLFGKQRKDQQQQATRRGNGLKKMQQMKRSSSNNLNNNDMFSLKEAPHNNMIPYWPTPNYNNNNISSNHINPIENNFCKFEADQFMEADQRMCNNNNNANNGYGDLIFPINKGQSSSQMIMENYNMGFDHDPTRVLNGLEFLYGDHHHNRVMDANNQTMGSLISSSCPSNYELAMLQDLSTANQEYNAKFDETLKILDNNAL